METPPRLSRSSSAPSIRVSNPEQPSWRYALRERLLFSLARLRLRNQSFSSTSREPLTKMATHDASDHAEPSIGQTLAQKQARKHLLLKCLEFSSDGACVPKQVTRQQILDVARAHGALSYPPRSPPLPSPRPTPRPKAARHVPPRPPQPRGSMRGGNNGSTEKRGRGPHRGRPAVAGVPVELPSGAAAAGVARTRRNRHGNALTMRDLRQVDPHFTAKPALWVRQHAVVVSLEGVRAIVFFDRMLLFDPDNADVQDFVKYVRRFLSGGAGAGGTNMDHAFLPFEFRALDAILENACYRLVRDFGKCKPRIQRTLGELPREITSEQLERLRADEQTLNYFYARARKVHHALQAVLDEDDDMADMYLTEKHRRPERVRNPLAHDEAETLLETHLQTVDDLTTKAELLNRTIDDTEDLIEIHLDTMQNRLLLVDLIITAISSILSFGSLVTNIFGMNLQLPKAMRFLPSSQYYFYGCVGLLVTGMIVAILVLLRWCRWHGLGHSSKSGHRRRNKESSSYDGDDPMRQQIGLLRRMRRFGSGDEGVFHRSPSTQRANVKNGVSTQEEANGIQTKLFNGEVTKVEPQEDPVHMAAK